MFRHTSPTRVSSKWYKRLLCRQKLSSSDLHHSSRRNQQQGTGGNATARHSGGANQEAKKTHPEAPDNIGMQDERGGKW
jgi:hypothetical protein